MRKEGFKVKVVQRFLMFTIHKYSMSSYVTILLQSFHKIAS